MLVSFDCQMETKKSKKSKNKKLEFILSWMQICICSLFPRTESFYSLRLLEEFLYDQYCLTTSAYNAFAVEGQAAYFSKNTAGLWTIYDCVMTDFLCARALNINFKNHAV